MSAKLKQQKEDQKAETLKQLTDAYNKGTLFKSIDEAKKATSPEYLWGNWLINHSIHVQSGAGGISKTTFNFAHICSLQKYGSFLQIAGKKDIKVLYLDLESEETLIKTRLSLLGELNINHDNFYHCNYPGITLKQLEPFIDLFINDKFRPDIIYIDPFSMAFKLEKENDNTEVTNVVMKPLKVLIDKWKTSFMLVHHTAKVEAWGNAHSRGAGAIVNLAHIAWNFGTLGKEYPEDLFYFHIPKNRWVNDGFLNCIQKVEGGFDRAEFPAGYEKDVLKSTGFTNFELQETVLSIMPYNEPCKIADIQKYLKMETASDRVRIYRVMTCLMQRMAVNRTEYGLYVKVL
jgi:hypothetical protein